MYSFGMVSQDNLESVEVKLQKLANKVLDYGVMDFSIIEGYRTVDRQNELYKEGKSTIDGLVRKGKHNYYPSKAIDVLPYPSEVNGVNVWEDKQRFTTLIGLFYAASKELRIPIRWGGDWDGDGNNEDSSFDDLPHIELL